MKATQASATCKHVSTQAVHPCSHHSDPFSRLMFKTTTARPHPTASSLFKATGSALLNSAHSLSELMTVQGNVGAGIAAVAGTRELLQLCLDVGALLDQAQLYPALLLLERIRGTKLGEWVQGAAVHGCTGRHLQWALRLCLAASSAGSAWKRLARAQYKTYHTAPSAASSVITNYTLPYIA